MSVRGFSSALALFAIGLMLACSSDAPDDTGTDPSGADPTLGDKEDSYYSCGHIDYPDESQFGGHSLTSQRVQALTQYANELLACTQPALDATFARRGVNVEAIHRLYEIRVEGEDCFSSEERRGWNDDLEGDSELEAMQRQVRSAVSFVKNMHEDLNGYPNRVFDIVSLCPKDVSEAELILEGRRLIIGVTQSMIFGDYAPRNALEIREQWSSGDHLERSFAFLSKYWSVLDPVGTPRIALRHAVQGAGDALARRLRAALAKDEPGLRSDMLDLVDKNIHAEYGKPEGEETGVSFQQRALAQMRELAYADLRAVAGDWSDYAANPDHWEGLGNAASAAHEAVARNRVDLDIEQCCALFNFANFHDINVDTDFFFGDSQEFMRYVTVEVLEWDVRVRQYGLINIWTSDNVNINVSVSIAKGLETAGLEKALRIFTP